MQVLPIPRSATTALGAGCPDEISEVFLLVASKALG